MILYDIIRGMENICENKNDNFTADDGHYKERSARLKILS